MSTTIAAIAKEAFDGVVLEITDAVADARLARSTQGDYNVATGAYALIIGTQTGRAVFTNPAAAADMFPDYVIGPNDQAVLLEGFTSVKEADLVTVNSLVRTVLRVQDISDAGCLFFAVLR